MKTSHLVTPRTLGDCQFAPNMDPIERPPARDYDNGWWWSMGIIAVFTVVIVVVMG